MRRPSAAIFLPDGKTLCVANARSGTISLVDVELGRVLDELPVGRSLVDLIAVSNRPQLLVIDGLRNELIVLDIAGLRLSIRSRWNVSPGATRVVVAVDGQRAFIACQWSRCLEIIDLSRTTTPRSELPIAAQVPRRVALPFAPGLQCLTPDGRQVIVADNFGGGLAIVDFADGRLLHSFESNGHNTRGLTLTADGRQVVLAQQILNQQLPTTRENIERGLLIQNVLRLLPLSKLLADDSTMQTVRQLPVGEIIPLGSLHAGAGDPAGVISIGDRLVVALAGVREVALVSMRNPPLTERIKVGRRPVAIVPRPGTTQVAVLNQLDDSISLLEAKRGTVVKTIALSEPRTLSPQDRGERLFFDARLSRDGWLSCHSCHTDGHSNGRLADTLGDNSYGTPKRTLTLLGTAFTYRWAWNGEVANLHDQVRKSLLETMHGETIRAEEVRDITSFLHTLEPPPPVLPRATSADDQASLERGRQIFTAQQCQNCHIPPIVYSSHESYEVGLTDERGLAKFNPPSLRGVSQETRFFHDNRAESLESVFADFQHPGSTILSQDEIRDLVRFLKSL